MSNFTPLPGRWRRGVRAYDAHTTNTSESNEVLVYYRSHSTRVNDERSSGVLDPLQWWEVRTPTRHHTLPNFPAQQHSHSRQQTNVPNGDMGRGFNPRLRQIIQQPHSRSTLQTSTQAPQVEENTKPTSLSKLKKVIYNNNTTPKSLARRVSLYYRDNSNALKERVKEKDEDGKRCAVCLEDFEPKEEVMLTPCNHMFHEDCIMPWLTSKGQCPVCRFVIWERVNNNTSSSFNRNNDIVANLEPGDLIGGELLSILRAMEVAFHLGSINYT
ncbi:RING-H2 finger protein ATL64-like isoform X2 [Lotus japonicus]|uniref:RING-H2 finger protein ATL64-like isoform X2 n=1 Tax=Lotus japonicus TaxID=34305 RepID=UPI00258E4269|nr:RING-H2 finger protein ATL64-like isoform X2 [Lotus japonicus]